MMDSLDWAEEEEKAEGEGGAFRNVPDSYIHTYMHAGSWLLGILVYILSILAR